MKKLVLLILCGVSPLLLGAQTPDLHTRLTRKINQAIRQLGQPVKVVMNWEKSIRVRDLLTRPARGQAGDTVVGVKTKTTYCRGYYSKKKEIYFPLTCMQEDDFKLARVTLVLPNGKQILPARKELRADKNIVRVTIP